MKALWRAGGRRTQGRTSASPPMKRPPSGILLSMNLMSLVDNSQCLFYAWKYKMDKGCYDIYTDLIVWWESFTSRNNNVGNAWLKNESFVIVLSCHAGTWRSCVNFRFVLYKVFFEPAPISKKWPFKTPKACEVHVVMPSSHKRPSDQY